MTFTLPLDEKKCLEYVCVNVCYFLALIYIPIESPTSGSEP